MSQSNTQYDQPATQTQFFDDMITDEDCAQAENPCWGNLVSRSSEGPHFNLQNFPPDDQGRYNVHFIGRSSQCILQLTSSPRISNKHCVIYCKQNIADPNNPRLEAWIEDLSANGTFINGETRLTKNIPRLLHHRDEIFLVNPEFKRMAKPGTKILEDIAQNSFVVMLNLPSPVDEFIQASRDYDMQLSQNEASQQGTSSRLDRANSVNRLLGQNRCIYDHYEIKTLLGEGTSGSVYHGINKDTGKDWAVKIIPIKNLNLLASVINNKGLTSVMNGNELTKEAELLRSLRHAHIIHLEDIFADNRRLFLVMELSSGGDLFDRIVKKKCYPEHEAKIVMRQILEAMAYLHDMKIAHRDIKPENILLVSKHSDVDVKLTDFGLAKKLDDSGKMKTFCGTPQYFAPEVLQRRNTMKGSGTYSLAADMWSIGVIMFVLLEGNYPFNENALSQQISNAQYSFAAAPWKKVSPEAKDLIRQLLLIDPAARITAKEALASAWFTSSQPPLLPPTVSVAPVTTTTTASNSYCNGSSAGNAAGVVVGTAGGGGVGVAVGGDTRRSETMSTNITCITEVSGTNASGSPRAAENKGGDEKPESPVVTATTAAVNSNVNGGGTGGQVAVGAACLSMTSAVQQELERVHLNPSNETASAPAETTSVQATTRVTPQKGSKRVLPATVASRTPASAVVLTTVTTGKRKLANGNANANGGGAAAGVVATPTRGGDKRSRVTKAAAAAAAESAGKDVRTIEQFFPKQSPAPTPTVAIATGATGAGAAYGGTMTRRATRSTSVATS